MSKEQRSFGVPACGFGQIATWGMSLLLREATFCFFFCFRFLAR
jgi:hypothetical protein